VDYDGHSVHDITRKEIGVQNMGKIGPSQVRKTGKFKEGNSAERRLGVP
jgi:hypothetical protein